MFPPRVIGIIGNQGKMAQSIYVPMFSESGYQVIGSDILDPNGLSNEEVIRNSDVVIFSILPLDEVANAISSQIKNARSGTLWLHGSSVQDVRGHSIADALSSPELLGRGVDTGFVHYMIAPSVKTLRGQAVVLGFHKSIRNPEWVSWLTEHLQAKKAKIFHKSAFEHDQLTKASQLLPMLVAIAIGMIWQREEIDVSEMLRAAGAPAKLQAFGVIRSLGQQDVVSEIVTRHPDGPALVHSLTSVFADLAEMVDSQRVDLIASEMKQSRDLFEKDDLHKILSTTDWLVRVLGDLNGGAVGFEFPKTLNKLGLLADVLEVFDRHGLDKTTTTAQKLPDGRARFYIGLDLAANSPVVREATLEVINELGAEEVEDEFTL